MQHQLFLYVTVKTGEVQATPSIMEEEIQVGDFPTEGSERGVQAVVGSYYFSIILLN